MMPELSLEDLLQAYRKEWKTWLSGLRPGDMLALEIDTNTMSVVKTLKNVTGVVLNIRNLPMNPHTQKVDTVMDVWINTPTDATAIPRGHTILGYVDVRKLTVLSRCESQVSDEDTA